MACEQGVDLDPEPNFSVGDRVRVGDDDPSHHVRTPTYLRGKHGTIVASLGAFRNPEQLAYGSDGLPKRGLYRVSFRQIDLWPDYHGQPQDTCVVEVYEHWLAAASASRDAEMDSTL